MTAVIVKQQRLVFSKRATSSPATGRKYQPLTTHKQDDGRLEQLPQNIVAKDC